MLLFLKKTFYSVKYEKLTFKEQRIVLWSDMALLQQGHTMVFKHIYEVNSVYNMTINIIGEI